MLFNRLCHDGLGRCQLNSNPTGAKIIIFQIVFFPFTDVPSAMLAFGPSLNPKNIKEGDDVYFECHVKSNPPTYNITWRHNVSS
jgi:hypothetical protein